MRWTLSIAGGILLIALALLVVGGAYIYSQLPPPDAHQCADFPNETISQTAKYRIEVTKRVCGGIVFSDTTFLVIRSEQGGQQRTFFSYAGESHPELKWTSDNVLVVELSDAGEIYTQADHVGDVQIRYHVGKALTKWQRHAR